MQIILSTAGISAQKNVLAIDVARASLIPVNISVGILSVALGDNKKLVSPPFGANFASSGGKRVFSLSVKYDFELYRKSLHQESYRVNGKMSLLM